MDAILDPANLRAALTQVVANAGAPGVDGVTVDQLTTVLAAHRPDVAHQRWQGTYVPTAVRRVDIPKPDGKGTRMLGIPTTLDRFIQQAVQQVLTPLFDPMFSEASFGFRPGRSAHDAIRQAQQYLNEGYTWVVDLDLEKFFDRVNHDILMARVARHIADKAVLRLIRSYLQEGIMAEGVVHPNPAPAKRRLVAMGSGASRMAHLTPPYRSLIGTAKASSPSGTRIKLITGCLTSSQPPYTGRYVRRCGGTGARRPLLPDVITHRGSARSLVSPAGTGSSLAFSAPFILGTQPSPFPHEDIRTEGLRQRLFHGLVQILNYIPR